MIKLITILTIIASVITLAYSIYEEIKSIKKDDTSSSK